MKRWIYVLLFLGIWGCENDPQLYDGEDGNVAGIYFQYAAGTINGKDNWCDSILFSFQNVKQEVKEYPMPVPVKILGYVTDYPRTFKVKVCGGTAVEGEDFVPLAAEYTIPAGAVRAYFPVILKRTEKLQAKKISIELELVENENFHLLLPDYLYAKDTLDATRLKIVYSEIISKPFYWLSAQSYFGTFSVRKFNILNGIMGWTTTDWSSAGMDGSTITMGKFNYAATLMREELQARADEGNPQYEEGEVTFMQLGRSYTVDYSRYDKN